MKAESFSLQKLILITFYWYKNISIYILEYYKGVVLTPGQTIKTNITIFNTFYIFGKSCKQKLLLHVFQQFIYNNNE